MPRYWCSARGRFQLFLLFSTPLYEYFDILKEFAVELKVFDCPIKVVVLSTFGNMGFKYSHIEFGN